MQGGSRTQVAAPTPARPLRLGPLQRRTGDGPRPAACTGTGGAALRRDVSPLVPAGVLAQVWRGGPQANLSRLRAGCTVAALSTGRRNAVLGVRRSALGGDALLRREDRLVARAVAVTMCGADTSLIRTARHRGRAVVLRRSAG